jgi:hypothetical protein
LGRWPGWLAGTGLVLMLLKVLDERCSRICNI